MKNYLQRQLLCLLLLICTGLLTAQSNLLHAGFSDPEDTNSWSMNPASNLYASISDDLSANGTNSRIFNSSKYSPIVLGDGTMDLHYFSFEEGVSSWRIPGTSQPFAVINDSQAASGSYALRFSFTDYSLESIPNAINVFSDGRAVPTGYGETALVTLENGKEYEFKIKLFMEDGPGFVFPALLHTNIANASGTGAHFINWDLTAVSQRGQWVEQTQIFTYNGAGLDPGEIVSRELAIRVLKADIPGAGSGIFYVDDISIQEVTEDPDPGEPFEVEGDSNWSGLAIPELTTEVVVNSGHLTIDEDVDFEGTITVKPTASVTLLEDNTLNVDKMVFKSSNPSAAVPSFINQGTLNAGEIEFSRYVPLANAFEYFSGPMSGQSLADVFGPLSEVYGEGRGLFTFDPIDNNWVWLSPMGVGEKSDVLPLQGFAFISDEAVNITFSGADFNEGAQTITLGVGNSHFNLVGNPYPSAVDWGAGSGWVRDDINPNIWINLADAPGSGNFATYSHATDVGTNWGTIGVDEGVIPPTQSFWVYANQDLVELTVNPTAQVHSGNVPKSMTPSFPLIRLQVEREDYTDEMVVLFHPEAAESVDPFDTRKKLGGGIYPQVYMTVGEDMLAVNALPATLLDSNVEIPFSLLSEVTGNVSISMTELKGFGDTWNIMLSDKATGNEMNLRDTENYMVEVISKDPITDQFKLIVRSEDVSTSTTDVSANILTEIYAAGRAIHIDKAVSGSQVEVYSINGSVLLKETLQSNGLTTIHTNLPTGIYVVVVNNGEEKIAKKVYLE